jgi:CBS domain-containing protein
MTETRQDPTQEEAGFDDLPVRGGEQAVELFMRDEVAMIDPSASLRDAAERLQAAEVGLLVVGTVDDVMGVVSERDIVRCVALDLDLDATTVATVESEHLKWAAMGAPVDDVAEEMMENYLRHMLVADADGVLVGVVSMRDLLTAYLT